MNEDKERIRIWKRQWKRLWRLPEQDLFIGSEIYGGLANTWDYGNLGVELKNNVMKGMVAEVRNEATMWVLTAQSLMNPQTWWPADIWAVL